MLADLKKAKTAELEAELALFREALGDGNDVAAEPKNNAERVAEIERLVEAHGHPVKLDAEFLEANPTLARLLKEQGANEGDIVFAEPADLEKAEQLDAEAARREEILTELAELGVTVDGVEGVTTAELEEKLVAAKAPKEEDGGQVQAPAPTTAPQGNQLGAVAHQDLFYQGKIVTLVNDVIAHGKSYKDVTVSSGETFRITPEEYANEVKNSR